MDDSRFPLPLLGIFAVAFAVSAYYGLKTDAWKVMTDELLYTKLAVSIFDEPSLLPHIHGERISVYNQLYPLITSPAYALFDMPTAFRAVHVINAAAMSSVVFPVHLLARELGLGRGPAYLAAALSVAVPWLTLVTLVFTEPVAYPAFAWALLAMQRSVARPSPRADLVALGGLVLAFLARTQLLVLAALLPAAIVLHEVGYARSLRHGLARAWREHRVMAGAYGLALLAALIAYSPSGLDRVLGTYGTTASGDVLPPGLLRATAVNIDYIAVGMGVVPLVLAAGWALWALVRPADRAGHAYAVLMVLVVSTLALQVSSFELRFGQGFLQERYLCYIAPLIAVAMMRCLAGPERAWPGVLAAGAGVAAMIGVASYAPSGAPLFASPAHGFYSVLDGRAYELGRLLGRSDLEAATMIQAGTVLAALALAAALVWLPRRAVTAAVALAVLAYTAAETMYVFPKAQRATTAGYLGTRVPIGQRNWVDQRLPEGATAGIVPSLIGDSLTVAQIGWWDNEFWNKTVKRSYSFGGSQGFTPYVSLPLTLDPATGRLETTEEVSHLVIARDPVTMRPASRRSFSHREYGLFELIEPERPYRAEWVSEDVTEDGWVYEKPARVRFYPPPAGAGGAPRRIEVTMMLTPELSSRRYRLRMAGQSRSGILRAGSSRTEAVTVCLRRPTELRIEADRVSRLAEPDGREVALRLTAVRATPAGAAACAGQP